ncbi:hypothetical protein NMG60_11006182 [Bertholletia excelsa]
MHDTTGKSASSLAIVEKRPHRPEGCVGIFFKLFDWKRRFAKKKLFSRKLLPPDRPKQVLGKFTGEEKSPKPRLIADENSGGFPNMKRNGTCNNNLRQKPGMRSPGLVARLMGLESMSPGQQDGLKKASLSKTGNDKEAKPMSSQSGSDKEDQTLQKGNIKHELRPQKLQKTGSLERQALSRFGHEPLHFKSVLSRSRKHRPKLASPVKSPRLSHGRNASRLIIDAAARILEPGLQATNKAKCTLTYSNALYKAPKEEVTISKASNDHMTIMPSMKGQSCKNCGSLLEGQPLPFASSASAYVNPPVLDRNGPKQAIPSLEQEKERLAERILEQSVPRNAQARSNMRTCAEPIANGKPLTRERDIQCHWTSQQWKPQRDVPPSSSSFRHNSQRQNQAVLGRDGVPLRSNLCNMHSNRISSAPNAIHQTKDFVSLNQIPSGRTRSKMPVKLENHKCDSEGKPFNKQDDSLSPVRKRRPVKVNQQCESSNIVNSTSVKQRNVKRNPVNGKGIGLEAQSAYHISRSVVASPEDSNRTNRNKGNDVISFTFNSALKQKSESDLAHCNAQRFSALDRGDRKMTSERSCPLSGEELGVLLEQKLKELTFQEEDELGTECTRPKRSTAVILQELISALTAERPVSHDVVVGSNEGKISCHSGQLLELNMQARENRVGASTGYSCDSNHLSPGSVLEAAFSNDSCLSSSVDDGSVPNLHPGLVNCTYGGQQTSETDAELLDSATSLSKRKNDLQLVPNLISHVSEILSSFSFVDTGMTERKLAHAEEVLLNAELSFRNAASPCQKGAKIFLLAIF